MVDIESIVNEHIYPHVDHVPGEHLKLKHLAFSCVFVKEGLRHQHGCSLVVNIEGGLNCYTNVPILPIDPVVLLFHQMAQIHGNQGVGIWVKFEYNAGFVVSICIVVQSFIVIPPITKTQIQGVDSHDVLSVNVNVRSNFILFVSYVVTA